tara:strand:- start:9778 stop:12597 length:2820 start_codon:yes stop_codon:yes gene_type:complete
MVLELLSRVLYSNRHIAFFLLIFFSSSSAFSQSVLLPADIVVVSVNSSGDSFDFIPLVPLKVGTTVWFSNGVWNSDSLQIKGNEVELVILEEIEAGTNIHVNKIKDPRVQVNGNLDFVGNGDRLFVFQKDEGATRVIFGIGWGNPDIWNPQTSNGSEVPRSISKKNNSLIQLGIQENYQYYLRNGASGTPSMLADFVADPAKWKGKNDVAFQSFGTTFRILRPPVVLFNESISTTLEGEGILLNVAIYEHDGSRLTVDAVFNTFNSLADTNDIKNFNKHTFNFTGLIGDAVYAIEIPIEEDKTFEGTENAFFELQNLSKGSYGDFVNHVSFIQDNELPSVLISSIEYSGDPNADYIEIQNNERIDVDISGWQLVSRNLIHEFKYGTNIPAFQSLRVLHPKVRTEVFEKESWLTRNTGTLDLKAPTGEKVSNLKYRLQIDRDDEVNKREVSSTELSESTMIPPETSVSTTTSRNEVKTENIAHRDGWYVITEDINEENLVDKETFQWNEKAKSFQKFDELSEIAPSDKPRVVYLTKEQLTQIYNTEDSTSNTSIELNEFVEEEFTFSISATDIDENGVINGSEGFNFLRNTTNNPIVVDEFLNAINSNLFEGAIYPYVYLWNNDGNGWMTSSILSEKDLIPANSSFWVRADSIFDSADLSIPISPYFDLEIEETKEELSEAESSIGISISSKELTRNISFDFYSNDEELNRDIISPELEDELRIISSKYLFFGAGTGLNWNSKINLEIIEDQKMIFPLAFKSSELGSMTLEISKWANIPADWKIFIEDLELEKKYEISQNWTFKFEYLVIENKDSETEQVFSVSMNESVELGNHRFNLIIIPPGVEELELIAPEEISLGQNYPNPFNPTTTIAFYLPEAVPVKLSVFNVVGQPVAVLTEGTLSPGDHEFEWDASGLPSGMYIYQLEVGNKILTQKMTLVK